MRRFVALLLPLLALACQPESSGLADRDVAAIRALGDSYARAVVAQDADAVAAAYAPDAIEMPPREPATAGRQAIRDRYAAGLRSGMTTREFTFRSEEIDGREGLAYDRGAWSWTGTPPGMVGPVAETGKYVAIARRQEDGSWLWSATIWNSDVQLPSSEPASQGDRVE
jgi:ketosteroid isomerase-like protein